MPKAALGSGLQAARGTALAPHSKAYRLQRVRLMGEFVLYVT